MKVFEFTAADKLIELALDEDIGSGDITSQSVIEKNAKGKAVVRAKQDFVLCGTDTALRVFQKVDPDISVNLFYSDKYFVKKGDTILEAQGNMISLLKAERTVLNFLQRMSGIATNTKIYSDKLKNYPDVKITDTRKTTPGMRVFEKYAVLAGGCFNHRTGLYDGILIKDNHIEAAGSIGFAVKAAKTNNSHLVKTEVEVSSYEQVQEALKAGADVIMLDNMTTEEIKKACSLINKRAIVEVSGNVYPERLEELAQAGADVISCGALIHQAVSVDISMSVTRL
ncbi:MAG: carboxylating nicotinate-nucleotide diphosphorylase [Thermodesulfobacteriota bacterium]